jgi:HEAT repeat protein
VISKKTLYRLCLAALVVWCSACARIEPEEPLEVTVAAAREGDAGAVGRLVSSFAHPDPEVAQGAWEAVVDIGPRAEAELMKALESENPVVAEHAAGALGSSGSKAAVEALVSSLEGWTSRRYVAAWALGEIGDPRAIPALVTAMGDEDKEVRKYATRSLIKFGREATEDLMKALGDSSPEVRHYAVRALGEIRDPRSVEAILAMDGRVDREVHLWALGRLGDGRGYEVVAAEVRARDVEVRLAAIQALRDLGDERAVPVLEEALEDGEWMIREWAARGLESITGRRYTYRDQHGDEVYPYALYR